MASDVVMPRLSDSMEEGTVLKWLVDVGGEVKRGQPLVEIETDKANMTYESDTDGVLVEVLAQEGDTLAVGEPIARVGEAGETSSPSPVPSRQEENSEPERGSSQVESATTPEAEPARQEAAQADGDGRVKASPVARKVAGELGVDIGRVEGTGPGRRIVKSDVEAAAGSAQAVEAERRPAPEQAPEAQREPAAAAPSAGDAAGPKGAPEVHELTRLQRTVSRRMAESKATAPDFPLELDVDMTLCIELRERLKQQTDPRPPSTTWWSRRQRWLCAITQR